jgi:hypothetical protein
MVHKLYTVHREDRKCCEPTHINGVYDEETESTLILFSNEAWYHLSEYMNSQNYRFPSSTREVPLT